ncbi:bifunctional phosphopantothenoylcysteine decarboxylase/phosphopantothenate--cysteine ligase CoaBC [Candidatus Peregrinibacteria bacterium]|nr:bifunctional phosphopantothenoylcysteine decarboxylase/phosphopantothenate--cysteine ligase CoaBC [Candidatus Peregrinibacteria bacterium]
MFFQGKKIVLGITAGVALYKMCDFIRQLRKEGAEVRVILTENAAKLVSRELFYAVSGVLPALSLFSEEIPDQERSPEATFLSGMTEGTVALRQAQGDRSVAFPHLNLIRGADAFLVAPATANILGKVANGIADDLLSTALIAGHGMSIFFAPAMNTRMWKNLIVKENCRKLKKVGYHIIDPEEGELACGEIGEGRMANLDRLFHEMVRAVTSQDFSGKKILITAGPTLEAIDPIRFFSNRSSGKMGYFLAQNAWHRGADVTVVSGQVAENVSNLVRGMPEVSIVSVKTADEMYVATKRFFPFCDACIFSAAVTDFRPQGISHSKLKKSTAFHPTFTKTVDIAEKLSLSKTHQKIIGFSLETENIIENARKKLKNKHFDMIVANTPETFGSDEIRCAFVTLTNKPSFHRFSKHTAASKILDFVIKS